MSTTYPAANDDEREAAIEAAAEAVQQGRSSCCRPTPSTASARTRSTTPPCQSLLDAKGRGRDMPPPVLISSATTLDALATELPSYVAALTEAFWPGPLTLVCEQQPSLTWDLGDTRGTVAVRMPDHEIALALLERTGPMAVSSANLSGLPAATEAARPRACSARASRSCSTADRRPRARPPRSSTCAARLPTCSARVRSRWPSSTPSWRRSVPRSRRPVGGGGGGAPRARLDAGGGAAGQGPVTRDQGRQHPAEGPADRGHRGCRCRGTRVTLPVREYLLVFLVAAAATYLLTVIAREIAVRTGAVARVRDRDVHAEPIPYLGGLAMLGRPDRGVHIVAQRLPFLSAAQWLVRLPRRPHRADRRRHDLRGRHPRRPLRARRPHQARRPGAGGRLPDPQRDPVRPASRRATAASSPSTRRRARCSRRSSWSRT